MGPKQFRNFFVISVILGAVLVSYGFSRIQTQQSEQNKLALQLKSLVIKNQQTLMRESETTVKSADTRITTVTQRCELTKLILEVLVKDDPRRASAFQKSLNSCEIQLQEVKQIAAHAKVLAHKNG